MAITHPAPAPPDHAGLAPSRRSEADPLVNTTPRRGRVSRLAGRLLARWWAVVLIIAAWHIWVTAKGYNHIVLPTPVDVARDLVTHPGAYAGDTARTFGLAVAGVAIGMALGFAVSVIAWASPLIAGVTSPLVLTLRSIPIVVVIPVLARAIGYGNQIVPIVTVMLAFFPAYVFTGSGLRSASRASIDVVTAMGGSRRSLLRRVLVPSAVPQLLTALRLCAASTVLAAMVAEFLAGTNGLGHLFSNARVRLATDRAWGAAVIATVLSVAFFQAALRLERWGRQRFR